MSAQEYILHYIFSNTSHIIQWILFFIGIVLILIPVYHNTTNFLKASQACANKLGMQRLFYFYTKKEKRSVQVEPTTEKKTIEPINIITRERVDTQVCLLSSNDTNSFTSGLVNTGNSCFLNSVLQSLSSLPKLHEYLNDIDKLSNSFELPVTRSLLKTIRLLSVNSNKIFQPTDIVSAMSSNRRVINREQQDAQELFQLISSELDTENQLAQKKQNGFRDILNFTSMKKRTNTTIDNPFTGLLANRLSCTQCGYTEAIRHFSFNNVQLTLPNSDTTTLDDCLQQLTTMEYLNDVTCRKCTLNDTVVKLSQEIDTLKSSEKMEKLNCLEKIKGDIVHRLKVGRIAEEIGDDNGLKGFLSKLTRNSSKQAMFAKPPKVLCLHIARSSYLPTGEIYKNTCHIQFPEVLDLSPYCTNGTLNTQPDLPISTNLSTNNNVKYRLMSSIIHYGSHNYGHFIAYKRKLQADKCNCHTCTGDVTKLKHHTSDWFKISDERVDMCSIDEVLEANPYMLLYELIENDSNDSTDTLQALAGVTNASTVMTDQEDQEEESISPNLLPAAPPSSPLLLPLQLPSSIVSSCSSYQPQSQLVRRNNKKNLWTKTSPVAIY